MRFIGINSCSHDAGIAVFSEDGKLMFYSESPGRQLIFAPQISDSGLGLGNAALDYFL